MPRKKRFGHFFAFFAVLMILAGGVFTVQAYIGDIDLDNLVNTFDLDLVRQAFGSDSWSGDPTWNPFADLDQDGMINVKDLAIAGRSYNSSRNFHYPRQVSNRDTGATKQAACLDGLDRLNIAWVRSDSISKHYIYFSRLDRFGNTLVDDIELDREEGTTGEVAVGCDVAGNAHIIWNCSQGLCQARFDTWGYPVISPSVAYDQGTAGQLAIDLDSQGDPHLYFQRSSFTTQIYGHFNTDGEFVIGSQGQLVGFSNTSTPYRDIALDSVDNVHLMWYELIGDDRVYYARYGFDASNTITDTLVGYTGYDGHVTGVREPAMAVDPKGNAVILYPNRTDTDRHLYLDKIDPDGILVLDDHDLFPEWNIGGYTPKSEIALDQRGNLHLFSITDFASGTSHSAYGIFDQDAYPIYPMRWLLYGNPAYYPNIMVDTQDDVHFIYKPNYPTSYPSCADDSVCYQGTGFNDTSYDLTRSDLGIDVSHLSWEPWIARWNQSLVITGTVFNAGWVASPPSSVQVDIEVTPGVVLGKDAQANVPIPALGVRQTYPFTATITLPKKPPIELEELEYLRLLMEVDQTDIISETTEVNNALSVPILVQMLPTKTGLFLMVEDETNTVRNGIGVGVETGMASIEGGVYYKPEIEVKDYITVLGNDIPVTDEVISYTIGWQADGYATPELAEIGIVRNATDPYIIDYHPSTTAVMVTNRWGSLSGAIDKSDGGGGGLEDARVRLVGQGLSIEAITDVKGEFSPSTEPKLAKLIPGSYAVRISRAGYERVQDTIVIDPLDALVYKTTMEPTTEAYVHGNVINTFGNPVVDAVVDACGTHTNTDNQGVFDLVVDASCDELILTTKHYYGDLTEPISLTAGLELILNNLTMEFDPPLTCFSKSDKVGSRIIDQSTGDLLPDPDPDASWLEKKIFEEFEKKFWPEYRIYLVYGGYAYNATACYSGAPGDRHMSHIQLTLDPKTFAIHMLLASVKLYGVPISLPLVDDSGERSAIWVVEARLVNTANGQVIKTVDIPREGSEKELIFDETTLTYDFDRSVSDWDNTEVWLYYKIGLNNGGEFKTMPQLYQHDKKIMKFDLNTGTIWIDYGLGEFPIVY